jgi:HAD superfamily hydrolase (TIGR01509 family)
MSRTPTAVVFDLDGVLIDSERCWDVARQAVVGAHGGHWQPQATRDMQGMSAPEWSRYLHERLGVELEPDEVNTAVVGRLRTEYREHLPLLPGAVEAVRAAASRWPLAVASSSNRELIELVLDESGLADAFAVVVSSEEVARGKPAPDVYLAAVQALGAAPPECVAVEDSTNGLRAAAAAGLVVVAVPNADFAPEPDALALAAVVTDSIAKLTPEVIERAARTASRR